MDHYSSRQRSRSRSRSRERDRYRHRDSDRGDGRYRGRERNDDDHRRRDERNKRGSDDSNRIFDRNRGDEKSRREDDRDRRDIRRGEDKRPRRDDGAKAKVVFASDLDDGYFNKPQDVDEGFDDDAMAAINGFMEDEDEDEETEDDRLAREDKERRQRREAILLRHKQQEEEQKRCMEEEKIDQIVVPGDDVPHHLATGATTATESLHPPAGISSIPSSTPAAVVYSDAVQEEDLAREEVAVALEERDEKLNVKTFDIFSSSPTIMAIAAGGGMNAGGPKRINKAALLEGDDPLLESNWDDGEGYYSTRVGEVICDRYRVMGEVGKGVFSTAVKCIDVKKHDSLVVLKIIRSNDIMRKASEKEIFLLQLIAQTDPQNKKHCVRLLGNTEYRNHIVLAFEALGMNLRETVKKFGKHVGINVTAVRLYARQLFVALRHLAELKIVHADIKPDNILVSEDLKQVKICDFGSAFRETDTDNDPTPYLQSRFYRAPEIVLGLPYDRMIDLWSVGACLYELFTGHVMFAGRTNNEMIRLQMEYKGKIPNKVVKAHQRSFDILELDSHFDSDFKFKMHDIDPVTNKPIMRLVEITAPKKSIGSILLQSKAGADDRQMVQRVADVLEKCLVLDPSKRVTVPEILKHPLFTAK